MGCTPTVKTVTSRSSFKSNAKANPHRLSSPELITYNSNPNNVQIKRALRSSAFVAQHYPSQVAATPSQPPTQYIASYLPVRSPHPQQVQQMVCTSNASLGHVSNASSGNGSFSGHFPILASIYEESGNPKSQLSIPGSRERSQISRLHSRGPNVGLMRMVESNTEQVNDEGFEEMQVCKMDFGLK